MAKARRKFYEGHTIEGKVIKEVFRNMAGSEYLITFTDGSYRVFKY